MIRNIILTFFLGLGQLGVSQELMEYTHFSKLMGSTFVITAIGEDYYDLQLTCYASELFGKEIEAEISSWDSSSFTSLINRNAGIKATKVPIRLYNLIERSIKISDLTEGAFDISYAALDGVWDFNSKTNAIPDSNSIANATSKVNYKNIILNQDDTTVLLSEVGMKIGFGGIGKGFLADEIFSYLKNQGIKAGIVNAGGDLITWGTPLYDSAWDIGLANPKLKNSVIGRLKLKNQAMVTSGDYEKYIELDGKKYAHILNPKTGMPVDLSNSVSVLCSSAELADALATAIFVMGPINGIVLVNKLKGIEAITIKNNNFLFSSGIEINQLDTLTYSGTLNYYADNATLTLCGPRIVIPINLGSEQINIERKFFQINTDDEEVFVVFEGVYKEEKRDSKIIKTFRVTKVISMDSGTCP